MNEEERERKKLLLLEGGLCVPSRLSTIAAAIMIQLRRFRLVRCFSIQASFGWSVVDSVGI